MGVTRPIFEIWVWDLFPLLSTFPLSRPIGNTWRLNCYNFPIELCPRTLAVNFVIYFLLVLYFSNYGGAYFVIIKSVQRNLTTRIRYKIHTFRRLIDRWDPKSQKTYKAITAANVGHFDWLKDSYTPVLLVSVI